MKIVDALTSDPIKGAALFAVIAPPLGAFVVCALGALPFLAVAIKSRDPAIAVISLSVVFIAPVFSHIFGAIPALITGSIVGLRRSMLSTWYGPLASGVLGALVTTFLYSVVIPPPGTTSLFNTLNTRWDSLLIFGLCAFFGGVGAGWLFRIRPSSTSKPLRGSG